MIFHSIIIFRNVSLVLTLIYFCVNCILIIAFYFPLLAVEQTDDMLIEEIRRAHVICVVYSVDDEDTLDRVTTRWLPLVRENSPDGRTPVILVGNKIDLVDYSTMDVSLCKYSLFCVL